MDKKEFKRKLVDGKGMFMYLRSVGASQISGYTDFAVSYVFFAFVNLSSALSAALGAIAGGIVNCIINYKYTFKSRECSYTAIGVKFFLVWLGSLLLNTFGTQLVNNLLQYSSLMEDLGVNEDMRFLIARIFTSLVVSILWNFMLQRSFVFKANRADHVIDAIVRKIKRQ